MKRILWLLCLGLCLNSANAGQWRPVVGVSGMRDYPSEVTIYANPDRWLSVFAVQYDVGIRNDNHEWYAALHLPSPRTNYRRTSYSFSDQAQYPVPPDSLIYRTGFSEYWESRNDQRLLIGYRYSPRSERTQYSPVLGFAVETGNSRKTNRFHGRDEIHYLTRDEGSDSLWYSYNDSVEVVSDYIRQERDHSDYTIGFMGELGVSLAIHDHMELRGICQCHLSSSVYLDRWFEHLFADWEFMLTPSFGLQLRYTFGQ